MAHLDYLKAISNYRLWIHGFNLCLFVLNTIFVIVAVQIFSKQQLLLFYPSGPYQEPSIMWLFVSVFLQDCVILLGTVAVIRCYRWILCVYWIWTLILLISDLAIGLVWVYKFTEIHSTFRQNLYGSLQTAISGMDDSLAYAWNLAQINLKCCGVDGYSDYSHLQFPKSLQPEYESLLANNETVFQRLPPSCCNGYAQWQQAVQDVTALSADGVEAVVSGDLSKAWLNIVSTSDESPNAGNSFYGPSCNSTSTDVHVKGCAYLLLRWFLQQADTLFIVGYCVIVMVKFIYVVILRKELKELMKEIHVEKQRHHEFHSGQTAVLRLLNRNGDLADFVQVTKPTPVGALALLAMSTAAAARQNDPPSSIDNSPSSCYSPLVAVPIIAPASGSAASTPTQGSCHRNQAYLYGYQNCSNARAIRLAEINNRLAAGGKGKNQNELLEVGRQISANNALVAQRSNLMKKQLAQLNYKLLPQQEDQQETETVGIRRPAITNTQHPKEKHVEFSP